MNPNHVISERLVGPRADDAMELIARLPYRELIDFAGAIGADVDRIATALDRYEAENAKAITTKPVTR